MRLKPLHKYLLLPSFVNVVQVAVSPPSTPGSVQVTVGPAATVHPIAAVVFCVPATVDEKLDFTFVPFPLNVSPAENIPNEEQI